MSQPKRYNLRLPQITYGMEESKDGEYVYHSDYAALAAENERLAASVRRLEKENAMIQEASFAGAIVTKTFAAENQRFRKALKDVEKAWYEQRAMDVIKAVDAAFEQEGGRK